MDESSYPQRLSIPPSSMAQSPMAHTELLSSVPTLPSPYAPYLRSPAYALTHQRFPLYALNFLRRAFRLWGGSLISFLNSARIRF